MHVNLNKNILKITARSHHCLRRCFNYFQQLVRVNRVNWKIPTLTIARSDSCKISSHDVSHHDETKSNKFTAALIHFDQFPYEQIQSSVFLSASYTHSFPRTIEFNYFQLWMILEVELRKTDEELTMTPINLITRPVCAALSLRPPHHSRASSHNISLRQKSWRRLFSGAHVRSFPFSHAY